MDRIKLTREEALRRWKASKELKRKMSEKAALLYICETGDGMQ